MRKKKKKKEKEEGRGGEDGCFKGLKLSFRTCPPSEKKAEVHRARKMMGMAGAASLACSKSINFYSVLGGRVGQYVVGFGDFHEMKNSSSSGIRKEK